MIPDWKTNTVYFSDRLKTDYPNSYENIERALKLMQIEPHYLKDTKDVWVRDFMPIQIADDKFVEYRYDPDYLQGKRKGYRNIKSYPDIICSSNNLPITRKSDLILDGGNIIKSSCSIILTDKVSIENRLTKSETVEKVKRDFNIDRVILIPWHKKERFGHADGVVRFINDKEVILHEQDLYNRPLIRKIEQNNLIINWLKFNGQENRKLNWAYINFLHMHNVLLIPKLRIDEDNQALERLKELFHGHILQNRIIQVDVRELVESGKGALNCISWTVQS